MTSLQDFHLSSLICHSKFRKTLKVSSKGRPFDETEKLKRGASSRRAPPLFSLRYHSPWLLVPYRHTPRVLGLKCMGILVPSVWVEGCSLQRLRKDCAAPAICGKSRIQSVSEKRAAVNESASTFMRYRPTMCCMSFGSSRGEDLLLEYASRRNCVRDGFNLKVFF